jgi:hypothetical protein
MLKIQWKIPGEEAREEVPEGGEDLVVEDDVDPGVRHCIHVML